MLNARELLRISNNKGRACGQKAAPNGGRSFNLIKKGLRLCLGLRKRSNDMERKAQAPAFGAIEGKQTVAQKLQAAGVSHSTYYGRLRRGWSEADALARPATDLRRTAQHQQRRGIGVKLQAAGISRVTFYARLRRGMSEQDALSGAIGEKVGAPARLVMPDGRAAVSVAEQNGVERRTFYRNVQRGKSVQEASK